MGNGSLPATGRKRIAVIDYDLCNPEKCGWWACEKVCPVNRQEKDCISHEAAPDRQVQNKPMISEELCIGCQLCVKKCPFGAISIVNVYNELSPIMHQFGENLFRVHGFPEIVSDQVIGLVGRNGIGKTTLMKILARQLIPNLGDWKEATDWKKVVKAFKGKQLFELFEKLEQNKLKVAYKPQHVDDLPKLFNGTVGELLKKANERNALEKIMTELDLNDLKNAKLTELSGGELQRLAIAATLLKKADIYAFDEPTSYLDVKQRLNAAKAIRALSDQTQKPVLVIEHDLAVMDYLADYTHILYGEPSVYGVVSNIKTVKQGINDYLEGYLKDENLRFRSKPITFNILKPEMLKKSKESLNYPSLDKKYSRFELKVDEGFLNQKQVTGILGPNGIGKTTFVKMLAGIEQPDNIELPMKLKIAYKPQYLQVEKNVTVAEFLAGQKLDGEIFNLVDAKLRVRLLNEKSLENLSGGELQRVAIASTLAREADILLLDEPSAYLDIEQRLLVADLIKSITNLKERMTLVVDHDIVFMDFVSDNLIVFEGQPGKKGLARAPQPMEQGMNSFLKELDITFRREMGSGRPRSNKPGSVLDREQKESGQYYYVK